MGETGAFQFGGGPSSPPSFQGKPNSNANESVCSAILRLPILSVSRTNRFPWPKGASSKNKDERNEDWWFCNRAADIYPALVARNDPRLLPAPAEVAQAFSIEMLYYDKPFGVHQYWTNLRPNATALRALFMNCPEAMEILPTDILTRRPDWRNVLCDMKPSFESCPRPTGASSSLVQEQPRSKDGLLGRRRREARRRDN